jgi:hypothetical protein
MGFEAWIAGSLQGPLIPFQLWGLLAELALLLLAAAFALSSARHMAAARWRVWAVLLAVAPAAGGALAIRLPAVGLSSLPGVPLSVPAVAAGLLTFVPVMLSAGLAGTFPTLLLGLAIGLTRSLLDTHQVLTIFEYGLGSWWIALLMRNDYAGGFFGWLRRPWGAAIAALPVALLLRAVGDWSLARGDVLATIDFVSSRLPVHILGVGLELLVLRGERVRALRDVGQLTLRAFALQFEAAQAVAQIAHELVGALERVTAHRHGAARLCTKCRRRSKQS